MNFLKKGETNWKYILIVVILAVIVGSGIWGYQYRWLPKKEVKIPEIKMPERRILIDQKIWDEISQRWFEINQVELGKKLNADPPTTKILYSNPTKGISLYLPYNPKWGTEKYKLLPYYKESCPQQLQNIYYPNNLCEDGISLGPPTFYGTIYEPQKAYFISYNNQMHFLPVRNGDEVIASLYYLPEDAPPRVSFGVLKETVAKDIINNISVVRYTYIDGAGSLPIIEVIGKKCNLAFICSGCSETERKIEEVIETIKFIE